MKRNAQISVNNHMSLANGYPHIPNTAINMEKIPRLPLPVIPPLLDHNGSDFCHHELELHINKIR